MRRFQKLPGSLEIGVNCITISCRRDKNSRYLLIVKCLLFIHIINYTALKCFNRQFFLFSIDTQINVEDFELVEFSTKTLIRSYKLKACRVEQKFSFAENALTLKVS